MKKTNLKDFMKKNLRNATMNKSELQGVCNYPIYPRDSEIYSDKCFVKIDNGRTGGSHWTCFILKKTNPTILIFSEDSLITFCLINFLNQ